MNKNAKIYIAGHTGLVGSALLRKLQAKQYNNLLLKKHSELDLLNQSAVSDFFQREKPEYVFLAAAKVGGIMANNTYPAQFIYENLQIQTNVIHNAYLNGVKKLLFLGSSCIYPKFCDQPMKEHHLLSGPLEPTNEPYALVKISGIKMCQSYNRQYGTNFIAIMPTNLYGQNDNFNLTTSHVVPAIIRKLHEAKINNEKNIVVWGTGSAVREFLYVDDMADGSIFLMNTFNPSPEQNEKGDIFVNIGTGEGVSIKNLVELIKEVVGFNGGIEWDASKPEGTPKKILDTTKINSMGWKYSIKPKNGIEETYNWYLKEYDAR